MLALHLLCIVGEALSFHLWFFFLHILYAYMCYFTFMTLNKCCCYSYALLMFISPTFVIKDMLVYPLPHPFSVLFHIS